MNPKKAAKCLGSLGGAAGHGEAKRRSKDHYKKIGQLSALSRKQKKKGNL